MIVADALYQGQPGEAEGKQDARPTDVGRPFKETLIVREHPCGEGVEAILIKSGFENGHMLALETYFNLGLVVISLSKLVRLCGPV